jgi:anti-sigma factor RsiW
MKMMKTAKKNCTGMEAALAEMLLNAKAVPAKVQAHVASCEGCRTELAELRATMELMDAWESPEPNPYFLSRLDARMREERRKAPEGWLARLRSGFTYGPATHARPLAAMALTLMLLVGGGTYLSLNGGQIVQPAQTEVHDAAVVHDLQNLDSNAQLLDQLEALSSNQNGD